MNDYVRFAVCTALGLHAFQLIYKTDVPKTRFVPVALGGAAVGTFGGMFMTLTHLGMLPLAHWWLPVVV